MYSYANYRWSSQTIYPIPLLCSFNAYEVLTDKSLDTCILENTRALTFGWKQAMNFIRVNVYIYSSRFFSYTLDLLQKKNVVLLSMKIFDKLSRNVLINIFWYTFIHCPIFNIFLLLQIERNKIHIIYTCFNDVT